MPYVAEAEQCTIRIQLRSKERKRWYLASLRRQGTWVKMYSDGQQQERSSHFLKCAREITHGLPSSASVLLKPLGAFSQPATTREFHKGSILLLLLYMTLLRYSNTWLVLNLCPSSSCDCRMVTVSSVCCKA